MRIEVNPETYIKDPESSDLGKRILAGSIDLIDNLGFEQFTFRKLGSHIGSPEASVYRYFESKHQLLLYLTAWYWGWMEYRLAFALANIDEPRERLLRAVRLLVAEITEDSDFSHINEVKLHQIVISESSKAYLTKAVDEENAAGAFAEYKRVVQLVSGIIIEIVPSYKYPHMLISTIIEGAHHERYFAEHLPKLTDVVSGEDAISLFYEDLIFKAIGGKKP